MSDIYFSVILLIFIISITTTLFYINKVIKVIRHHRSDTQTYMQNAMPAIRAYKTWNTIFCLIHLCCICVLATHEGRVCAGWYIYELPLEQ